MNFGLVLKNALRNLSVRKTRFAQAVLCIVVGVAGVVLVLCVSGSLLNFNKQQEEQFSSTLLLVHVMTNVDFVRQIAPAEMEQLSRDNPDIIKGVSPLIDFDLSGGVSYGGKVPEAVYIEGVGDQYLDMMPVFTLLEGRFLQPLDIERDRRVCVIGDQIANELMDGDALGKELKIWGENYEVVGVLGVVQSEHQTEEETCEICIPYPNAKKMVGQATSPFYPYDATMYYDRYFVDANGKENMKDSIVAMEEMIERRTGMEKGAAWQLMVTAMEFLSFSINDAIIFETLLYMAGALIILIVGGVGIMNVMQAVVAERTREIGVRKAFGATNRDIRRQFMLEAVIVSLIGGVLGIALGLGAAYAACALRLPVSMGSGISYPLDLSYLNPPVVPVMAAVAACALVGTFFGTYPAERAAKLEIVEAINAD